MEHNIKLSLVQTSQDRRSELVRFVNSLNAQQGVDLSSVQLIFYDQGQNDDVFDILNPRILLTYIKGNRCSLSKARNICLPEVKGTYVAFSDDDCWYEPDTLSQVLKEFSKGYDGIIGHGIDAEGKETNSQGYKEKSVTFNNQCGAISYCIFMKFDKRLLFDENIGVGSPYRLSSGEETDYLLSYMELHPNFKIIYKPDIIIHHPTGKKGNFPDILHKDYEYARGWGYVLRKHKLPLNIFARSFLRPMLGIVVFGLSGKLKRCQKSYLLLKGRLEGYKFQVK